MRILWLTSGMLCVIAGFAGAFLPLLPTVPFLLLAAFFFGKSSRKAHYWLMSHKQFGPSIRDWQENGAISRKSKFLSAGSMIAVITISILANIPVYVVTIQLVTLISVSCFIWTRPDT
ncbi:hypothetical protein A9Q96_10505 [Rhodobacterales bacterium 52_120_T64]|nr:hypothetical protein A9Q96_10505 [Rhodobacterales bacterium 52_120_T64]